MVRVIHTPPPPRPVEGPGPVPLTHHDILALVAPFSAHGRHVDLAASDRANREIAFQVVEHGADGDLPALRERLVLANPAPGEFRLTREVRAATGEVSRLTIEGDAAGTLLAEVERVPVQRQLVHRGGVLVARDYRIVPTSAGGWRVELTGALARIDDVTLTVNTKTGRGFPAELVLRADGERKLAVPQDLLAVLGWDWRPLRQFAKSWRGSLRLAKNEPARTASAEYKINQTVEHLARSLARTPAEFHARWQRARWRVTFQRSIPLLLGLLLLAVTPLVKFLELSNGSILRMLIFHAPPILMILLFTLREMPVIEVPPIPRPLTTPRWVEG